MIKTQLCPAGELENRNWWHVDAIFFMVVVLASYYGVNGYLDARREEVGRLNEKKASWEKELASKKPQVEKFKTLNQEMETLNQKIGALQRITTSKIDKVKPLVALDQLQTLWMDGVWYEGLEYTADGVTTIRGAGYDSLLIGEFMLGLRESMNEETRNDDIRTQIGFDELKLKSAKFAEGADAVFPDVKGRMQFELSGVHREKKVPTAPTTSAAPLPRARGHVGF